MIQNNVRAERSKLGISQAILAEKLPDGIDAVGIGFIENGRVLPTKAQLEGMCATFRCEKTDLYDETDIDLLSEPLEELDMDAEPSTKGAGESSQHKGMVQFRTWLRPREKEVLEAAVLDLGYRSCAEWMREMIRNTTARSRRLHIKA